MRNQTIAFLIILSLISSVLSIALSSMQIYPSFGKSTDNTTPKDTKSASKHTTKPKDGTKTKEIDNSQPPTPTPPPTKEPTKTDKDGNTITMGKKMILHVPPQVIIDQQQQQQPGQVDQKTVDQVVQNLKDPKKCKTNIY
jgi:hypothetical protein